jgi:V/A-type H+/Na+-transporting ATPase subunit D
VPDTELSANCSVALELGEERRLVQEGYEFLDEKRVLLAAEILKRLAEYQRLKQAWSALQQRAASALLDAAGRHGLEGLSVYPVCAGAHWRTVQTTYRIAGVSLIESRWSEAADAPVQRQTLENVNPSAEARTCAELHRELLRQVVALAALARNLRRLAAEYRRTERRARALESVLIPELDMSLRYVEEQLEVYDLEEATRVHEAHRTRMPRCPQ